MNIEDVNRTFIYGDYIIIYLPYIYDNLEYNISLIFFYGREIIIGMKITIPLSLVCDGDCTVPGNFDVEFLA